jgi:hypothetical protein
MAEEVKVLSASETKKEDWMNSKWRPMMGWMYMLVCMMDMVIFPILWSLLQTATKSPITQWMPLTLQGAGLFHIAMGAVLGIAAFGRTQEKLGGANNGGLQTPGTGFQGGSTAFGLPQSGGFGNSGGFGSPAPSSFGGGFSSPTPSTSFTPAPSWGSTQIAMSSTGKPMPLQPQQPEL